jgi:sulfoxide reductase catalytic subunit YedY
MIIRKPQEPPSSEITPKPLYLGRREFLQALPLAGRMVTTTDSPTPHRGVTTYNNFYEFGTDKSDPATYGTRFKPQPWSVTIAGECGKPGVYTLEDILKPHPLEERIYRMRCVEAWSMVIPWAGFPLRDLLTRFEPNGNARFVEFTTILPAAAQQLGRELAGGVRLLLERQPDAGSPGAQPGA